MYRVMSHPSYHSSDPSPPTALSDLCTDATSNLMLLKDGLDFLVQDGGVVTQPVRHLGQIPLRLCVRQQHTVNNNKVFTKEMLKINKAFKIQN